jgi:tetratricopeptide (TPR) repeat protein
MIQQVQWASGKPDEPFMLALQGNAAAYSGRLEEAREFFGQAITSAQRRDLNNAVADFSLDAGRWEACSGNCDRALDYVSMALSSGEDSRILQRAAMVFALCGRTDEAQELADKVDAGFPTRTYTRQVSLPTLRAAIALGRNDLSEALQVLGAASPKPGAPALWPRYLTAEAYRRLGLQEKARAEYQYVLNHRCMETLSPLCALARLGLARSEAASGDKAGSSRTYQELFTHWNHADSDVPIFRQALAEYSSQRQHQP